MYVQKRCVTEALQVDIWVLIALRLLRYFDASPSGLFVLGLPFALFDDVPNIVDHVSNLLIFDVDEGLLVLVLVQSLRRVEVRFLMQVA